jgi:hypothetical protein
MRVSRILVDEGYQTDTVHDAIRCSEHSDLCLPAKGYGVKAGQTPIVDWQRKRGEPQPRNEYWRTRVTKGRRRSVRTVAWDTNYWATFLHQRLLVAPGGDGRLAWWGKSGVEHRLLAAHLTARTPEVKQSGSREIVEWNDKPAKPDDDLGDALAMCAVAASEQGIVLMDRPTTRNQVAPSSGKMSLGQYLKRRKPA